MARLNNLPCVTFLFHRNKHTYKKGAHPSSSDAIPKYESIHFLTYYWLASYIPMSHLLPPSSLTLRSMSVEAHSLS